MNTSAGSNSQQRRTTHARMAISALRAQQERICAGQYMDTLECVFGGQCIGPDCPDMEPIGGKPKEE